MGAAGGGASKSEELLEDVWVSERDSGVSQVWVSTAARGSGGWRDMSGDAMTAAQNKVKRGLDMPCGGVRVPEVGGDRGMLGVAVEGTVRTIDAT